MNRHHDQPAYAPQFKHDDFQFGLEIALGARLPRRGRRRRGARDRRRGSRTATPTPGCASGRRPPTCAEPRARPPPPGTGSARSPTSPRRDLPRDRAGQVDHRASTRAARALAAATRVLGADRRPARPPGERSRSPTRTRRLPGVLLPRAGRGPGEPRPLVVINNGSDGATSQMWVQGGAAASERGYHWMTFDGPGQQAALFEQRLRSGPTGRQCSRRWSTPWPLDPTSTPTAWPDRHQPGGLLGSARARVRAPLRRRGRRPGRGRRLDLVADQLPGLHAHPARGRQAGEFDKDMGSTERLSRSTRAVLRFRGEPYGLDADSRLTLREVFRYRLGDEVQHITRRC